MIQQKATLAVVTDDERDGDEGEMASDESDSGPVIERDIVKRRIAIFENQVWLVIYGNQVRFVIFGNQIYGLSSLKTRYGLSSLETRYMVCHL